MAKKIGIGDRIDALEKTMSQIKALEEQVRTLQEEAAFQKGCELNEKIEKYLKYAETRHEEMKKATEENRRSREALSLQIDDAGLIVEDTKTIMQRLESVQNSIGQHAIGVSNVFEKYEALYEITTKIAKEFKGLRAFVLSAPELKEE